MRIVYVIAACLVTLTAPAEIYRWVDAQGNTHFSDTPVPNAEKLDLPPLPTYRAPPLPKLEPIGQKQESKLAGYKQFSIVSPGQDSVVWNDERNVSVQFTLSPNLNLKAGHRIVVLLDGTKIGADYSATSVVLAEVDRGTHTLSAYVRDAKGAQLKGAKAITFHLRQHTVQQANSLGQETPRELKFPQQVIEPKTVDPNAFRRTLVQPNPHQ